MQVCLFSLYDVLAKEWGNPFVAKNTDVAVRVVRDSFRRTPNMEIKDYQLFCMGTFDSETGCIVALPEPDRVHADLSYMEVPVKNKKLN